VRLELEAALIEFGPQLVHERLERAALDGDAEVAEAQVEQTFVAERGPAAVRALRHGWGLRAGRNG
jgi:hypothetical protein